MTETAALDTDYAILPCFVCGKTLSRVFPDHELQPSRAVMCETHGNYGSCVFDPYMTPGLVFLVCDDCLVERQDRVREAHVERVTPKVKYEPWDRTPEAVS